MTDSPNPRQTLLDAAASSLRSFLSTAGTVVAELAAGRMAQWLWATIPTIALVGFINVEALGGVVKVLAKMTLGAWLGYWIDRATFRNARPHQPLEASATLREESDREGQSIMLAVACAYMLRRAAIIGACVLASAIGV